MTPRCTKSNTLRFLLSTTVAIFTLPLFVFPAGVLAAPRDTTSSPIGDIGAQVPYEDPSGIDLSTAREIELHWLSEAVKLEKAHKTPDSPAILKNLAAVRTAVLRNTYPKLTAVGNFQGDLAKQAPVKIIYGVSSPDFQRMKATFGNVLRASEYLNQRHIPHTIEIVVYDVAVRYFAKTESFLTSVPPSDAKMFKTYVNTLKTDKNVRIVLCRNAMTIMGMVRSSIPSWIGIVPMASLEIFRQVHGHGYTYMTN